MSSISVKENLITEEVVVEERIEIDLDKQVVEKENNDTTKEVVEEKVIQEAVNEIVTYGTKTAAAAPAPGESSGKTVVSKQEVLDCDGSGHGYYDITYSDGSHEYIEF